MSDYFEDAVVRGDLGEKRVIIGCEGFFRLTVEDFCENAIEIIKRVMLKGDRILGYLVVMLISTIAIATPGTSHCLSVSSTKGRNSLIPFLFIKSLLVADLLAILVYVH
jgi:hypothetical protein